MTFLKIVLFICITAYYVQADKYTDENRPYEFGFTIEGEQHRHEKKDENGIIMGEFGFITADGVYHVTVYATDENGNFKILSMKNIRVKPYPTAPNQNLRQGHSLTLSSSSQANVPPSSNAQINVGTQSIKQEKSAGPARTCSHCSVPTTTPSAPKMSIEKSINNNNQNNINPYNTHIQANEKSFNQQSTQSNYLSQNQNKNIGYNQNQITRNNQAAVEFDRDSQSVNYKQPSREVETPLIPNNPQNSNARQNNLQPPSSINTNSQFAPHSVVENSQVLNSEPQITQGSLNINPQGVYTQTLNQKSEVTEADKMSENNVLISNNNPSNAYNNDKDLPNINSRTLYGQDNISPQKKPQLTQGSLNTNQQEFYTQNQNQPEVTEADKISENNVVVSNKNPSNAYSNDQDLPNINRKILYGQENTSPQNNPQYTQGSPSLGTNPKETKNQLGVTGAEKISRNDVLTSNKNPSNAYNNDQDLSNNNNINRQPKSFNDILESVIPEKEYNVGLQSLGSPQLNENLPTKPVLIAAQMQIVDKNTDIYQKKPGEEDGLPEGLSRNDMKQLLYTFNYTLGFHAHHEEGYTNGAKYGYYFVTGRNGIRTRVDYVADDTGFHPKISQEVLDLQSEDVPKPETERDDKYGLKGYEFKWLYYPVDSS